MTESAPRRFSSNNLSINTKFYAHKNTINSLEIDDLFRMQGRSRSNYINDILSINTQLNPIKKLDKAERLAYLDNDAKGAQSISTSFTADEYDIIDAYHFRNIRRDYSVSAVRFERDRNALNDARKDSLNQAIAQTLEAGSRYIEDKSNKSKDTHYNLKSASELPEITSNSTDTQSSAASTVGKTTANSGANQASGPITQNANNTRTQIGTLRADNFTFQSGYSRTIFSGNGNVDYGSGARDLLDLSQFDSSSVAFNYATNPNGGVAYNLGNGNRIFDAVTLGDGSEILFEGIEAIRFADTTINLSVTPNDSLFNQQWNLHGMGAHNAWRFTTGSDAVMIGIQDTGLATDSSGNIHSDLRSTNFVGNNYIDESDSFSHGTLVQGTIAAASNNGIGGAGINWNSGLIHLDVVGNNNGDYNLATATQAMIDQANAQGKRLVVNMSLAGGYSQEFEQLIANNQDGALFVIAAGNGNLNSVASPANLAQQYANVVAVGASWGTTDYFGNPKTPGDRISYQGWWGSNYGEPLTIMAPSEFTTTSATRNNSGSFDFGYNNFNGTSASTANVSGVASLIWSVNPNLSAGQIKAIISETAYDLGNPGYDQETGYGFINADAAVRRALAITRGVA